MNNRQTTPAGKPLRRRQTFRDRLVAVTTFTLAVGALGVLPLAGSVLHEGIFIQGAAMAQDDEREPPPTRSSQTLSRQVYTRIEEVMELRDEDNYAEALEVMGEIREMYNNDRLNDRETFTMFQFYADIAQQQENYGEAIDYYRQILELPNVTVEQREQTLFYMGTLQYVEQQYRESIDTLNRYLDVAQMPNDDVYLRIGTAHYQLEEYREAIPYVLENMNRLRSKNEPVPQNTFGLLRALYLSIEDYENARDVLRDMVVIFNEPDDWGFLAAINAQLERFTEQAHTLWVADAMGYLESENRLMNLASQLFNNDNPYRAAQVVELGMEEGIIEENESNLSFLSQAWQVAREDARAAPPLERAAEMSDDGQLYARLGRIYMTVRDFENAVEAFTNAFDQGGLDRPDQTYLQLARAYMELDRYDEALDAAGQAEQEAITAEEETSRENAEEMISYLQNEQQRYERIEQQKEELAEYFDEDDSSV